MEGVQWMLSFSVVNVSCGISKSMGKWVVMVLLIRVRLLFCVGVRFGEKFIIGK